MSATRSRSKTMTPTRMSTRVKAQASDNSETIDILAMAVANVNELDRAEVAAANGFEDISSDSNSSFDQTEFEAIYGPPSDWGCGKCGLEVQDSEEGVQCDGPCKAWVHARCAKISTASYRRMVREEVKGKHSQWLCPGTTRGSYYNFFFLLDYVRRILDLLIENLISGHAQFTPNHVFACTHTLKKTA